MATTATLRGSRRWLDADALLLAGSAAGLLVVGTLLLSDGARGLRPPRAAEPPLARLARVEPGVLHRPPGTLVWDAAAAGEPLAARDSLYVPPAASATVSFDRGAYLDIEERSLVVIEAPDPDFDVARVTLTKGSLSGSAAAGKVSVRTPGGLAVLDPGAEARVGAGGAAGPRVDPFAGRTQVDGGEQVRAEARIRLEEPARSQRFWFAAFPASIPLRWDGSAAGGARLEVARDPSFGYLVDHAPGEQGAHAFRVPAPGRFFWRLVGKDGSPASEVRRLLVVQDRPPTPFAPLAGEIVLAPGGVQVPFWWTAVDGASHYRLEISASPSFEKIGFSTDAEGPGLWANPDLPEGIYYWRVRAREADRKEAPYSAPSPFRLIHRPLPDAPQLFDPAIEVDRGIAR